MISTRNIIGAGAKVLGDINIGNNIKIGAGSILIQNILDGKIIVFKIGEEIIPIIVLNQALNLKARLHKPI